MTEQGNVQVWQTLKGVDEELKFVSEEVMLVLQVSEWVWTLDTFLGRWVLVFKETEIAHDFEVVVFRVEGELIFFINILSIDVRLLVSSISRVLAYFDFH